MQPLDGITVVSFEQAVSGPLATRHLADLGARVIKVERPGEGDFARDYEHSVHGTSAYFVWLNRGKESMALDLKDPAQHPVMQRLVEFADVVVHNLTPNGARRLGLAPTDLVAARPELVACAISGYGSAGQYSNRKAYDLLVQCEAALLSVTGTTRTPSKVGISIADIAAGMYAYASILAALLRRERSGEGAVIEVSMFDALVEWMSQPLYATKYGGLKLGRSGPRHTSIAPYGPYQTADRATVFIAVQNEREWRRLCLSVLASPKLAMDPRFAGNGQRVAHRRDLEAAIAPIVRSMPAVEFVRRLDEGAIAWARQSSLDDLARHPLLASPSRWWPTDMPGGTLQLLRPPVSFGHGPRRGSVPGVGEDTQRILTELGMEESRANR